MTENVNVHKIDENGDIDKIHESDDEEEILIELEEDEEEVNDIEQEKSNFENCKKEYVFTDDFDTPTTEKVKLDSDEFN
jgi:hypothetical protein